MMGEHVGYFTTRKSSASWYATRTSERRKP